MLLMIKQQDGEYAYTYETDYVQWTPLNSNLQMQGIKVKLSKDMFELGNTSWKKNVFFRALPELPLPPPPLLSGNLYIFFGRQKGIYI